MDMELSQLVTAVGRAVQDAQSCLERQAVESYCGFFRPAVPLRAVKMTAGADETGEETGLEEAEEVLTPITRRFSIPAGPEGAAKETLVPEAALVRHDTMALDTVHITLKFLPSVQEEDGALLARVGPNGEAAEASVPYSQLDLTFHGTPASEGISRINQDAIKSL